MATITSFVSPFNSGFDTGSLFIPGRTDAQGLARTLAGAGASVTVDFTSLNIRFTYTGTGLTRSGGVPTGGLVTAIQIGQWSAVEHRYLTIGKLELEGGGWAFADAFTPAYAAAFQAQANQIIGTDQQDTLRGGDLADLIQTRGGNDVVFAGGGADILHLRTDGPAGSLPASASLSAQMGAGTDTLRVSTDVAESVLNLRDATLRGFEGIDLRGGAALVLDADDLGAAFPDTATVASAGGGRLQFHQLANQPFSAAHLRISGDLRISVIGTAVGDVQLGNADSRDILDGRGGGDRLRGLAGNDTLLGGTGMDTLDGGGGTDSLIGGDDDDLYIVNAADVIVEQAAGGTDLVQAYGHHTLEAGVENIQSFASTGLRLIGNDLANQIGGGAGADTLGGMAGNDTIAAADGADVLTGGAGDDILNAQGGNDILRGDAGNDRLIGNLGADTLSGGEGADVFLFRTGDGRDVIRDFATNGEVRDVIDLSELAGVTGWADLLANHMTQQGLNVVITVGADVLVLERVWLPLLGASDFLF